MPANQAIINPGETAKIMFQLIDLDQGACARYIPDVSAVLEATIPNLDQSKILTKIPTNPFPQDKSIWQISLSTLETQSLSGINLKIKLTENTEVKIAVAEGVIIVGPKSVYSC